MTISIIIPTLNEEKNIGKLIRHLFNNNCDEIVLEIIVSDGGSSDDTVNIARAAGAQLVISPGKGRAVQMNYGAAIAGGDIFYFIHADTIPPDSYATDIVLAVNRGYSFGRYRTQFEGGNWLLKINAFFTRFDLFICYGGDQTFFITKSAFRALKGYNENLLIMEEYELTERAKGIGNYKIMPKAALISARKYRQNTWWQVQKANYIIVSLYKKGTPQEVLVKRYYEMIKNNR